MLLDSLHPQVELLLSDDEAVVEVDTLDGMRRSSPFHLVLPFIGLSIDVAPPVMHFNDHSATTTSVPASPRQPFYRFEIIFSPANGRQAERTADGLAIHGTIKASQSNVVISALSGTVTDVLHLSPVSRLVVVVGAVISTTQPRTTNDVALTVRYGSIRTV